MKRIAVIGGGAAGLSAAIAAARACGGAAAVTVYEMDERVGRRILYTGNGRCNFSNQTISAADYRNPDFVAGVFSQVTPENVLDGFARAGLMWTCEGGGRLYPATGKASTVVDVLRGAVGAAGVDVCGNSQVVRLDVPGGLLRQFALRMKDGRICHADAVVVAGGGFDSVEYLPPCVEVLPFEPVLGPLKTDKTLVKPLDNIRVRARAALVRGGEEIAAEQGELLFRKYGVSGICVFNLSRFAKAGDTLRINLMPGMTAEEAAELLEGRRKDTLERNANAQVKDVFCGMLLPLVADLVLKVANADGGLSLAAADAGVMSGLAFALQNIELPVEGIAEPGQCQVHRGGVAAGALDGGLQSTAVPGLFFAGEMIDVDGPCGGYNLHWAWSSGILAGRGAAEFVTGGGLAAVSSGPAPLKG